MDGFLDPWAGSAYIAAMAILDIIETPDARLRVNSKPVARVTDAHRALIADMFETMYDAPGIGLAAVQVGVAERILVIDLQRPENPDAAEPESEEDAKKIAYVRDPRVFINPEITWESEEVSVYNEGCLSVPDMYGDIDRPARVRATWLDEQGAKHEAELDGLLATCLQHEMDHLDGVLFIDHLSKLKRDMLLKKLEKMRRGKAS